MLPIESNVACGWLHAALACCMLHVGGLGCMSPAHYGNTSFSLPLRLPVFLCVLRSEMHAARLPPHRKGGGGGERETPSNPNPNPNPIGNPKNPRFAGAGSSSSPRVAFCASIKPNKYYLCIFWVIVSTPPRCAWTPLASFFFGERREKPESCQLVASGFG